MLQRRISYRTFTVHLDISVKYSGPAVSGMVFPCPQSVRAAHFHAGAVEKGGLPVFSMSLTGDRMNDLDAIRYLDAANAARELASHYTTLISSFVADDGATYRNAVSEAILDKRWSDLVDYLHLIPDNVSQENLKKTMVAVQDALDFFGTIHFEGDMVRLRKANPQAFAGLVNLCMCLDDSDEHLDDPREYPKAIKRLFGQVCDELADLEEEGDD